MDGEHVQPDNVFPIREEVAWNFTEGVEWSESGPVVKGETFVIRASSRHPLIHAIYRAIQKSMPEGSYEDSIDEILRLFDQSPLTYEESKTYFSEPQVSAETPQE